MEIASLIIGIVDDTDQPSLWRASGTAWFEGQIRKIFLCWRREKLFLQSPIDKGVNLDDKHSYQLASGYNLEHMGWCDVLGSYMSILIVWLQPWGKPPHPVLDIGLFDCLLGEAIMI